MKCDFHKSDDIYDGEISLGTKPGVPAEYDSVYVYGAQLQAKDASLQEALKEIAKLELCNDALVSAIIETQKHCYDAEEKARKKSQDLTTAKMVIIDNNAHIENLERWNSQLEMTLRDTIENLDMKHQELIMWKARYAGDCKEVKKFWDLYCGLGADLFYQMTHLEVIIANGCRRFFFEKHDLEIKARAAKYLPLSDACTITQAELFNFSMEAYANHHFSQDAETEYGRLRLAIEAPPAIDETDESSSFVTSEIEQSSPFTSQETSAVDDWEYLKITTPAVSILETNSQSDSEASLLSISALYNSEEGLPDSATSNEPEPDPNSCEKSGADSINGSDLEDALNAESRGLSWLLGYDPEPEESHYPQYPQGRCMVESLQEQVIHEVPSEGSPNTEGPGLQPLPGFNLHPEEDLYPQRPHQEDDKNTDISKMIKSAENEKLTPLLAYDPVSEESIDPQEPQSFNEAKELPVSTCNEPAAGPNLAWLLRYNPEPEEAFYPQYSQQHEQEEDSTSPASIEQAQEHTSVTVPDIAPIFEVKPDNHVAPTTSADSTPLAVDVSFADTSKDLKEEVMVQNGHEDTASTASTELEQQETSSKTCGAAPIFGAQVEKPPSAATLLASEGLSVNIAFGDTSQPFKAGAKVRMTRAQRREAAIKAQAEAMASKQKVDGRVVDDEGGKYGRKESRQERRAAERKASKAGSKQSKRNVWTL